MFMYKPAAKLQSRGLGFSKALDLKQLLGEELEEGVTYTQWPRLLRQILGASVLVSGVVAEKWMAGGKVILVVWCWWWWL